MGGVEDAGLQALAGWFRGTLLPQKEERQGAELALKAASEQPGFAVALLRLLSVSDVELAVRQAVAVSFKNLVRGGWGSDSSEKEQVKGVITRVMLSTPPAVRTQLCEALTIISSHDFPERWPTLLPELVGQLDTTDLDAINGVLATVNSIFKRYRDQYASDELVAELASSQGVFLEPLLRTMQALDGMVRRHTGDADVAPLKQALASIRLVFRIFYSLNTFGVTELVDAQLPSWMEFLSLYLAYDHPALAEAEADAEDKEGVLDAVKSAVCHVIDLFESRAEEDFERYLPTFMGGVWGVLTTVTARAGQDALALNALRFLTSVASGVHAKDLFAAAAGSLEQVCSRVILPNIRLREEDEEMFECNWLEYVRRDSEGGDSDTRRRAATDLLRALAHRFEPEVTAACSGSVASMLAEHASSATAWKAKDCAVYLVTAVTVRGRTAEHGATRTNPLVDVVEFFRSHVLPELQSPAVDDLPMLKAGALRFLTTFRSHLPKDLLCSQVFPALARLLGARSNVVHTYAAVAVERLLALRTAGLPLLSAADLAAALEPLLVALFAAFELPDSGDNAYVMRAVMRVIGFVGPSIAPVAPACLQALARLLLRACKNPRYPSFSHYLFESVAALVRHAGRGDLGVLASLEGELFPPFQHVLQGDVQELHPYVFQIFSQLIEARRDHLPAAYLSLFPPLLSPVFWQRGGNVPSLVRLLQAYLSAAPETVTAHLPGVLGVFQKLISSKTHDVDGFHLLCTVVECLPAAAYATQHLPTIWQLLLQRLMSARTTQYVRAFSVWLGLAVCKLGPVAIMESVDALRQSQSDPSIFMKLLQQVWVPAVSALLDHHQPRAARKVVAAAATKLLYELPSLLQDRATWECLRDELERRLVGVASPAEEEDPAEPAEPEPEAAATEYTSAHSPLANAARPEHDPLPDIQDLRQFFDSSMAVLQRALV